MAIIKHLPVWAAVAVMAALIANSANATPQFMRTGNLTSQPVGHYELCKRMPDECRTTTTNAKPVNLTRKLWKAMVDVNNAVNASVTPRTDQEMWGTEERWSYPEAFGDCEDYVLEKRRLLMDLGVPAGNLLITVVRQPNGDGHAVLTVATNMGDFILDNLDARILPWTETEYTYLKRQSARNSGRWISINDGRAVAVGSVSTNR